MGRRSKTGGVAPKGDRIQFTFAYSGVRCRPTIGEAPTQTNLKAARRRLVEIRKAIADGTFSFAEEFPDYKPPAGLEEPATRRLVTVVAAAYIESLRARHELAFATVESYRKILARHVQPQLGGKSFEAVTFAELDAIANAHQGSKKTFNNVVSAIRSCWAYGYKNLPGKVNPAEGLAGVRIPRREQPKPDPFPVDEAEAVVAAVRRDWGELQGNYDEFRFFGGGGLRPSEEIALEWTDVDFITHELAVTKARVMGRPKDETKNYEDRLVEVTPRGMAILNRQRALYSQLKVAGRIARDPATGEPHNRIFFHESGIPFNNLQVPWKRWDYTMQVTLKKRERTPYAARHSSVSWMLMIGRNFLWVAEQHGHSPAVMLKTYAKWIRGADKNEAAKIVRAFGFATDLPLAMVASESMPMIGMEMSWRSERDSNPHGRPDVSTAYSESAPPEPPASPPESPDLPPDLPPAIKLVK